MEARETISTQKGLYTIKIPLKDFDKLVNNGEIWYGGKLYDVSSYTIENESASVVIFHDEQEEGLVKTIINNFEPYDQYIADNTVHIVKHRIHAPDDSKILVTQQLLYHFNTTTAYEPLPYFSNYISQAYTTVLKPPPNQA